MTGWSVHFIGRKLNLWSFVGKAISMFLAISSCHSNRIQSVESRKGDTDHNSGKGKCLAIRSGSVLGDAEKKTFSSVGMIGFAPAVTASPVEQLCNATLIRPNLAITSQLQCVTNLDLTNIANSENLVFTPDAANPLLRRKIKEIIRWRENVTSFRDAALLVLEAPYDETVTYFDLKQSPIGPTQQQRATLVGSGGYVNGTATATYSTGTRRFGEVMVNGTATANIRGFDPAGVNPPLIYSKTSDYIRIDPLAAGSPLNCDHDNGAPGIDLRGYTSLLLGIANGSATSGATDAERCANASIGVLVPVSQLQEWLVKYLPSVNPGDFLIKRTIIEATVQSIENSGMDTILTLKQNTLVDDGLGINADSYTVKLCNGGCSPASRYTVKPEIGKKFAINIVKPDQQLQVLSLDPVVLTQNYKVSFNATISNVDAAPKTVFGRAERAMQLNNAALNSGSGPLPMQLDKVVALLCDSGCSQTVQLTTAGFVPTASKGVSIQGDVYQGKLYVRSLAANADFDIERVAANPTPGGISSETSSSIDGSKDSECIPD